MSILVWNCRGLGNPRTVSVLRNLSKEKYPTLVFLVETKCRRKRMEVVRRCLQMDGCFSVDCVGHSGGIALLWKEEWSVTIINNTRWHISALIQEEGSGSTWQFTGFYGHPDTGKRSSSWQLLKMLKPTSSMAWLCAGDFNEILHQRVYLVDRSGRDFTKEKIDRALGNKEWNDIYNHGLCTVLPAIKSYHSPLSIVLHNTNDGKKKRRWCFRSEMAWELKEECQRVVGEAWQKVSTTNCEARLLRTKLGLCQKDLFVWRQTLKQQEHMDIIKGEQSIGHLQNTGTGEHLATMKQIQKEASQRRKINAIKCIEDSQGRCVTEQAEIGESAFVPGRLISDNTLVAYEILHSMNSRMKGKRGFMALKLDMSKAYDRVEWKFIEAIMTKMEFPVHWINIIKACLNSVSYLILVNGEPQQCFLPSRGLSQGDPLSPYLFILSAEALTSLLNQAEACGKLTLVLIERGPVRVNHMFFVDDSLLFCQAKSKELNCVLHILDLYEKGSGQVINNDKSAIFFSKNTAQVTQKQILQLAGKEILLKVVLQAIPTYAMGMFLLPASITSKLNQMLRKFWWGFNEDSSKIQWVNWKKLSNSKEIGGLGFRDLRCFNIAVLSKQGLVDTLDPGELDEVAGTIR
ncbi:hypothetical protein F2P56_030956, partial [Juglans regia]